MKKLVERIDTVDAHGAGRVVVHVFGTARIAKHGGRWLRTAPHDRFTLRDGGAVIKLDSHTFEVEATGEQLRRVVGAPVMARERALSQAGVPRCGVANSRYVSPRASASSTK